MKKMTDPAAPVPHALVSESLDAPQPYAPSLSPLDPEPQPPAPPTVTTYPLSFTGSAAEYFRIWIVNVALSVITLGFYTPWARVRTRKYFYGHTWLDGHNFEYTANPWALLRGYLIVAVFWGAYALSSQFPYRGSDWVIGIIAALFVLTYPWLVRQSMRFLARSTVHRGLSFRFLGTLPAAYMSYGLANLAAIFSAGLALPWAWSVQRDYQVSGVAYGSAQGRFRGDVGAFYVMALTGVALAFGGSMILGLLGLVLSGGLALSNLGSLNTQDDSFVNAILITVVAAYVGFFVLYGLAGQYVRGAIMKYVLSNVELGGVVRLGSNINPWMLVWITISNYVAQVFTLGLLTPWAAVRRTKYVLDHIQVRAITSLDDFTAVNSAQEIALGEAATELLDINIGF